MRVRALAGFLALAGIVLPGCDSDRRAISRADLPAVDFDPVVTITIDGDGFEPDRVQVGAGDTIAFSVSGDGHGAVARDDRFSTGVLFDGETSLVILDTPGTVTVEDVADRSHTMEVVVTAEDDS